MNTDDEAGGRGEVKTTKRISIHEKKKLNSRTSHDM
jgi:hypothetical protein